MVPTSRDHGRSLTTKPKRTHDVKTAISAFPFGAPPKRAAFSSKFPFKKLQKLVVSLGGFLKPPSQKTLIHKTSRCLVKAVFSQKRHGSRISQALPWRQELSGAHSLAGPVRKLSVGEVVQNWAKIMARFFSEIDMHHVACEGFFGSNQPRKTCQLLSTHVQL